MQPELHVRHVVGRYPRSGTMRSENIEVQVQEIARVFQIRIDDLAHSDAWFELTVEVESVTVAEGSA